MRHLVAGDDRHVRRPTPSISSVGRALSIRPLVAMAQGTPACGQVREQLPGAGQRPDLADQPRVGLGVEPQQAAGLLGG